MLGKLLKYEWKGTLLLLPLNLALIGMTLIGKVMLAADVFSIDNTFVQVMMVILVGMYFLAMIVIASISFIYLIVRFYKTVYTDEGYLLHTLPVTVHEIIWSKLLIAVFWTVINALVLCLSVWILLAGEISATDFRTAWYYITEALWIETGFSAGYWIAYFMIASLVGVFYSFLAFFGCISLGQLFGTHRVVGAVASYAGIYAVTQVLSGIWMAINNTMDKMAYDPAAYMNTTLLFSLVFSIVGSVILYFVSSYMMSRKLNLE